MSGRLYVGTSGFAYPDWAPLFYPPGTKGEALLPAYASRLSACELNNTFYRHPTPPRIAAWLAATPDSFRFTVKAQRGGSTRAFSVDPEGTLPWLTAPYRLFAERLGCVLFRVPDAVSRDDERLRRFLGAWPSDVPLAMEFQHPSWVDDDVLSYLRERGAVLCTTELDESTQPPALHLTAAFLYLRLRRDGYQPADLDAWAARLSPFLHAGHDCYVFFRHDAIGRSPLLALELAHRVERVAGREEGLPRGQD